MLRYWCFLYCLLFAAGVALAYPVVINEFMASNGGSILDEDGDDSDWIELYNAGTEVINLAGYGLSDDATRPFRWVFPEYTIQPGGHLLVWASGKDRQPVQSERTNGILREVYTGISGSTVSSLTSHASYPNNPTSRNLVTDYFEAPINVDNSYGQRMHGYILAPVTGAYKFWISSDDNSHLYLSTSEDPAQMALIAQVSGSTSPRQWTKYSSQASASITLQAGHYYYICALMKEGSGGDHLAVRWQLPDGVIEEPIGADRLFVDGQELHTNFSISAEGEPLLLTMPDGTLADNVDAKVMLEDLSYGRSADGGSSWVFFQNGTPKASNTLLTGYTEALLPPEFSSAGGFYSTAFDLSIGSSSGATIYYTLDGSEPTTASSVYTSPLPVDVRHNDPNVISMIVTTPSFDPSGVATDYIAQQFLSGVIWMPPGRVEKATVVRAIAVKAGAISSAVTTQTYWVDPQIHTRFTMPVVSLNTTAENLFDYSKGIYVPGALYSNSNPARPWHNPANYKQDGDAWERPIHAAVFGADGLLWFEQDAGVRLHGAATRSMQQKTLRLYARGDYGGSSFKYPVFEDQADDAYKRLLLRNGGNDWNMTMFRDGLAHRIARHMRADTQAYRPATVFINGEYWGIHNLRERYDKHYLARTYGVGSEQLDIYDTGSFSEGDSTAYNAMTSYVSNNDMSVAANFAHAETLIDTEEMIDYFIAQIFASNTDWPGNNIACWRLRAPYSSSVPYGHDGRWRWLLFDMDYGYGYRAGPNDYTHNTISTARGHTVFNRLLNNAQFRQRFVNRFADQLNTGFLPERILNVIEEMKGRLVPEMPRHIERWKRPSSMEQWDTFIDTMRTFSTYRANAVRGHLRSQFSLGADVTLSLNVSNLLHGYVRVNSTDINADTPGVNASTVYPWSGTYFQNTPIIVTAVPMEGFRFLRWQDGGGQTYTQQTLTLPMTSAATLTAHFQAAPASMLMHYWSFNNADALTTASYTLGGAAMAIWPGPSAAVLGDSGQDFAGVNNRLIEITDSHLRVNNPLGTAMIVSVPTTGYEDVVLRYETRRSGSGAGQQMISYSTDGSTFTLFRTINIDDADPVLQTFDFSQTAAADNNPLFKIKIEFAQGIGATTGNNRFDNLTLDGVPLAQTNCPPQASGSIGLQELIEQQSVQIDLSDYFSDDSPLAYTAAASQPLAAQLSVAGSLLTIQSLQRGETAVQIAASDGVNPAAPLVFRVLVYPAAKPLRLGLVRFGTWSPYAPEHTYPADFLFLQSNVSDPARDEVLEYAYDIPHDDYAAEDQANIGYPYKNTSRTRINGLGDSGISLINTGRDRDLGGVLTAIDTRGVEGARVSWLAGTILQNTRLYAIGLQYRVGHTGPFTDVLSGGSPVEYVAQTDGHVQMIAPVDLPAETINQPYVQLLWRYSFAGGISGSRSQLRLDDIAVSGISNVLEDPAGFAEWWLRNDCGDFDHCGGADLTQDGRVNLADFAVMAAQWMNENTL